MTTTYEVQGLYGLEWETVTEFDDYAEAVQALDGFRGSEYGIDRTEFRLVTFG